MGHTSKSVEDSTEGKLNCEGSAQEVSEGKNIGKCPRDCSWDVWAKNMAASCPVLNICLR